MPVTAFGIRFSDNDFGCTLTPWVKSFARMLNDRGYVPSYRSSGRSKEITKEYIESLFKKTIGSFYLMYQADSLDDEESTIDYLETYPVHIYLNEEVGEYITKCEGWDNGEFYYWYFDEYDRARVDSI